MVSGYPWHRVLCRWRAKKEVMFCWEGVLPAPQVRTIGDMRSVLRDPDCRYDAPLYFMYRDLARNEADYAWLRKNSLRYDITEIPPANLCGEPVKTKGHYHPRNPAGTGYPEVYEVLAGTAHYLLQSRDHCDIVVISAGAGSLVVIPPEYGHVTINPSPDMQLVMANVVSTAFSSEYAEYEALQGAAYYETDRNAFERNPRYGSLPDIRRVPAERCDTSVLCTAPLYGMLEKRESFEFLNRPERYTGIFTKLLQD